MSCFLFFLLSSTCLAEEIPLRTIGVVAPLTGLSTGSGQTIKNSIDLAVEESSNPKIKFLFEDDQFEPKNTVTAVRKLIEIDHVDGLIVWGTPTSLAVNGIAEKAKIPLLAFSLLDKVVEDKKFVMKHWLPSSAISAGVTSEVIKRHIKTVSLVVQLNDAMLKLKDDFLKADVTKVLSSAEYPRTESDFRSEVTKIKSLNPDAVYLLLWAPQPSLFAKQLRAAGYKGQIFGMQNLEDQNEIAAANSALENAWLLGTDDSKAGSFTKSYKDKFNSDPVAGGCNAYDVARIFIGCGSSADLNLCLHSVKDFHGVLGTYSATERNDFSLTPLLKCIHDGKITADGC